MTRKDDDWTDIDYWDLPCVGEWNERRANEHRIDLHPHVSGADEPHDVTRILDDLITRKRLEYLRTQIQGECISQYEEESA